MPTGWIYHLKKSELTSELEKLGISAEGSIDDLRRRLSRFVTQHPEMFPAPRTDALPPTVPPPHVPPTPVETAAPPWSIGQSPKAMEQIRKWDCHFDGSDPLSFLERIDECRAGHELTGAQLLQGIPALLRGRALLWYRNHQRDWTNWEEFLEDLREYFLPPQYRERVIHDIVGRLQKPGESFQDFSADLLTLMRRAGGYTDTEKLATLYRNMHPRYKFAIRQDKIQQVRDLARRAREFESLEEECRDRQAPPHKTSNAASTYDRTECCWRCKQRGHTRADCKRPPKRFCSQCGKDGVFTRECHPPPPGNDRRAGDSTATPRPAK